MIKVNKVRYEDVINKTGIRHNNLVEEINKSFPEDVVKQYESNQQYNDALNKLDQLVMYEVQNRRRILEANNAK